MKKIKRTITMRKIELIGKSNHDHELNLDKCPLCQSPIRLLTVANDSEVENSVADTPLQITGKPEIVLIKGDKND